MQLDILVEFVWKDCEDGRCSSFTTLVEYFLFISYVSISSPLFFYENSKTEMEESYMLD